METKKTTKTKSKKSALSAVVVTEAGELNAAPVQEVAAPVVVPMVLADLNCYEFNGVLKATQSSVELTPELYLQTSDSAVVNRRSCDYTGKQLLRTVADALPVLSSSTVFVYPDAFRFPGRVINRRFDYETVADLNVPLSDLEVERFIARLDIAEMPEGTLCFSMKCDSAKGEMQVSIGYNHRICSNYTIFGRGDLYSLGREFSYHDFRAVIERLGKEQMSYIERYSQNISELTKRKAGRADYLRILGGAYDRASADQGYLQYSALNEVARKNVKVEMSTGWDILNAFTLGVRLNGGKGVDNMAQVANVCEYVIGSLN